MPVEAQGEASDSGESEPAADMDENFPKSPSRSPHLRAASSPSGIRHKEDDETPAKKKMSGLRRLSVKANAVQLSNGLNNKVQQKKHDGQRKGFLLSMLTLFDADQNGQVTQQEWNRAANALRMPVEEDDWHEVVEKFDRGHSGVIDYSEMVDFMGNSPCMQFLDEILRIVTHTLIEHTEALDTLSNNEEKQRNHKVNRILRHWRDRTLRSAYVMWVHEIREKKRRQRLLTRITKQWMHRAVNVAFQTWVEVLEFKKHLERQVKKVAARMLNSKLSSAMYTWTSEWEEITRKKKLLRKLVMKMKKSVLAKVFQSWVWHLQEGKRLHDVGVKIISRMQQKDVGNAFDTWVNLTEEMGTQKQRLDKVMRRVRNGGLFSGFVLWHAYWLYKHEQAKLIAKSLGRLKNRQLAQGWESWASMVGKTHQQQDKMAYFSSGLHNPTFKAFVRWADIAYGLKQRKKVIGKVLAKILNRVTATAFGAWVSHIEDRKWLFAYMTKAFHRWEHQDLAKCFYPWRDTSQEIAQLENKKEEVMQKAMSKMTQGVLLRCFNMWLEHHQEAQRHLSLLRRSAAKVQNRLMGMAFASWLQYWETGQAIKRLARRSLGRMQSRILQMAFDQWCEFTDSEQAARKESAALEGLDREQRLAVLEEKMYLRLMGTEQEVEGLQEEVSQHQNMFGTLEERIAQFGSGLGGKSYDELASKMERQVLHLKEMHESDGPKADFKYVQELAQQVGAQGQRVTNIDHRLSEQQDLSWVQQLQSKVDRTELVARLEAVTEQLRQQMKALLSPPESLMAKNSNMCLSCNRPFADRLRRPNSQPQLSSKHRQQQLGGGTPIRGADDSPTARPTSPSEVPEGDSANNTPLKPEGVMGREIGRSINPYTQADLRRRRQAATQQGRLAQQQSFVPGGYDVELFDKNGRPFKGRMWGRSSSPSVQDGSAAPMRPASGGLHRPMNTRSLMVGDQNSLQAKKEKQLPGLLVRPRSAALASTSLRQAISQNHIQL